MIVRHGPAEERSVWRAKGRPDGERPLTKDGQRKVREAARGLSRWIDALDLVATSPWARAVRTAEILGDEFGAPVLATESLLPGRSLADFRAWLGVRTESRLAAVGHEPHLSRLIAGLLGVRGLALDLKKSQAVLLRWPDGPAGPATLVASVPPRLLRAAGR